MNSLNQKFSKKHLAVLIPVLIAIGCAMGMIWIFGFKKVVFGDANDYMTAAKSFLNGLPYPRRSEFHPMFRPPLYPIFIAAVWKIFPDSIVAVKVAQALLHGATCFLVYRIAYELLRNHVPAFLGALVCAVNPLLAAHTVDFFTEPLHTFLLALAMLFIVKLLKYDEGLYLNAALAGVAFGLATLCRPSALGVALSLLPVIVLLKVKALQRSRALAVSVVLLAGTFAAILPWTIYNYRTTGEFILVNDGFSYNLWLGSLPETIRLYEGEFKDAEDNQQFADYIWGEVQRAKLIELERTDNYSSLKINEREKVWRREAMKNLKQDYSTTARIMFGKVRTFWTPFLNRHAYGWKVVAIVALFVISVYLLSIYGAYILSREKTGRDFVILLAVSFVVATLIHVLIMGFVRYRAPYVDPYVSMLAGVALWRIGKKLFSKKHLKAEARA
jgi:4-amino-4-deoxy-L-arabinose transferase-like glycosyltransferase